MHMSGSLARIAWLLVTLAVTGCTGAGGYDGPPDTSLLGERSHGHP